MTPEGERIQEATAIPSPRLQTINRYLSMVGAALALGSLIYASITLHHDQSLADRQAARMSAIERAAEFNKAQTQSIQKETNSAEAKTRQTVDEITFAEDAYQRIARTLPEGTARDAIEQTAIAHPESAKLPPVIYIEIAREAQRRKAKQIQDELQAKGWEAPEIEYAGDKAPQHSQLRFVARTDKGPAMQRVLSQLRSLGVDIDAQDIKPATDTPSYLRPNQFELWLGKDYTPSASKGTPVP